MHFCTFFKKHVNPSVSITCVTKRGSRTAQTYALDIKKPSQERVPWLCLPKQSLRTSLFIKYSELVNVCTMSLSHEHIHTLCVSTRFLRFLTCISFHFIWSASILKCIHWNSFSKYLFHIYSVEISENSGENKIRCLPSGGDRNVNRSLQGSLICVATQGWTEWNGDTEGDILPGGPKNASEWQWPLSYFSKDQKGVFRIHSQA